MDPFAADSAATEDKPLNWSDVPLEAVKNIPSDAYETGKGIVGGAVNVAKTVAPYARYGIGAPAAMATDAANAIYNDPSILKKLPAAVWNNLVESYGSEEALKHTIANHPVKFAGDLATVLSGGEAAISRGLGAVSDIAKAADVSKPFFDGLPREARHLHCGRRYRRRQDQEKTLSEPPIGCRRPASRLRYRGLRPVTSCRCSKWGW